MIRLLAPLAPVTALAVASCAPVESMPRPDRRVCDAARVQQFVGRDFAAAMGERARRLSGSRSVRVIRPGQAVTMDFREDRLNVELDERDRVRALRCG